MMRLLVVTQYFWPENFIITDLLSQLSIKGFEVSVLTGKPNYPIGKIFDGYSLLGTSFENKYGIKIFRVPIFPRGKFSKIRLFLNYFSFILSAYLFGKKLIRGIEYDLVFVFAPSPLLQALPAIYFANKNKVPLIVWVQDLWPESLIATGNLKNKIIINLITSLVRIIYKFSNTILVQSRAFSPPVGILTNDPSKIRYYPNFFKVNSFKTSSKDIEDLKKLMEPYFCIVFAGNLGTAQDMPTIIKLSQLLLPYKKIKIVLVGSGNQDEWLLQQKNFFGLTNLDLPGRFEASDMPAIFDASDALLVSLRSDHTFSLTIPSKLQAYLAAGRPILAALDGEGARIVKEAGAGLCSEAGNAFMLKENVLKLFNMSHAEKIQMGVSGRKYFEKNFSSEVLVNYLIEIFKETISISEKK